MKTIQRGETSLFAAVMNQNEGNEAVVKYLVEHRADITVVNYYGETLLWCA